MEGHFIADLHLALANQALSNIMEKKTLKEIWNILTNLDKAK